MKKINAPKATAFVVIIGLLGSILFAFQNFTPHLSKQPSDVSDLYMNGALSTALKTKEKAEEDKQVAYGREISWDDNSAAKNKPEPKEDPEQDAPDFQE